MLKFIKHHMETITGIEIYPLISFVLFFSIFVLATVMVIRKDRGLVRHLGLLPLDDSTPAPDQRKQTDR